MIKTILVAIDGSEHAWKALDLAIELAKGHQARLTVLHVLAQEPVPEALRSFAEVEGLPAEEEAARFRYGRTLGDALTREAEARASAAGLAAVEARTAEGKPAAVIVETATALRADMIVMGSRGLSEPRALLLGSVSHKVAHLAPCTCVTVK
jgi:nucleotide-binding universal stress UspA family protein